MSRKAEVGDTVMVEQAFEDEYGNYHDATARVESIDDRGVVRLKFDDPEADKFLKGTTYLLDELELKGE